MGNIVFSEVYGTGKALNVCPFMWFSYYEKLAAKSFCNERHLCSSSICPRCNQVEKSVNHDLIDCYVTRQVWSQLLPIKEDLRFTLVILKIGFGKFKFI